MANYYRVLDIPGLKDLIVRTEGRVVKVSVQNPMFDAELGWTDSLMVSEIINANVAIGDSSLRWNIPPNSLWIGTNYLTTIPDPQIREFSVKNPFGKLHYEGHYNKGDIKIDYAQYERTISVNLTDVKAKKTIYSQNYFDENVVNVKRLIENALSDESTIDDLVFSLKDIAASDEPKPLKGYHG